MNTWKKQSGLNMLELMAILVVIALIGAMAVPRADHGQANSPATGQGRSAEVVKSAHASAIAELKRFPTVNELSGYVDEQKVSAVAGGVKVSVEDTSYTVSTFSDSACKTPTKAVGDTVACVGNI